MFFKEKTSFEPLPLPHRMSFSDAQSVAEAEAFREQMAGRHSVRHYEPRPVPREVIESCIRTAGSAPSGANHQPWHFVAISNPAHKHQIRLAAEEEERKFYAGGASDEWLQALAPMGTSSEKPHLDDAAWLIVIFAQRYGEFDDGTRFKNYYVNESVGIATGFLIAALHHAGLVSLTHTPNPMKFLNGLCRRPEAEKPVMILAVGHAAEGATVPQVSTLKKPLEEICSVFE